MLVNERECSSQSDQQSFQHHQMMTDIRFTKICLVRTLEWTKTKTFRKHQRNGAKKKIEIKNRCCGIWEIHMHTYDLKQISIITEYFLIHAIKQTESDSKLYRKWQNPYDSFPTSLSTGQKLNQPLRITTA